MAPMRITRKDPPDPGKEWGEEKERLQRSLADVGLSKCLVCGSEVWEVNGLIYQDLQAPAGMVFDAGRILVVVAVSCGKCGNTFFFKYSTLSRK